MSGECSRPIHRSALAASNAATHSRTDGRTEGRRSLNEGETAAAAAAALPQFHTGGKGRRVGPRLRAGWPRRRPGLRGHRVVMGHPSEAGGRNCGAARSRNLSRRRGGPCAARGRSALQELQPGHEQAAESRRRRRRRAEGGDARFRAKRADGRTDGRTDGGVQSQSDSSARQRRRRRRPTHRSRAGRGQRDGRGGGGGRRPRPTTQERLVLRRSRLFLDWNGPRRSI